MRLKLVYILLFTIGLQGSMKAQLNDYKYIIVPKRFDAFSQQNMHQTSTMIKYFFTQSGFNAVYEDALPADLVNNRCLGLVADLLDDSSLFTTKTTIILKDCENNEVFRSIEGRSKSKEYRAAYKEAIENSFVSFRGMDYAYRPKQEKKERAEDAPIIVSFKDDVKSIEKKPDSKIIQQEATIENQSYVNKEPKVSNYTKAEKIQEKDKDSLASDQLYAQSIENGYQLVDSTSKVILKLQKTSVPNIFLVDYEDINGVVFKKEDKWVLEYSENGKTRLKELDIKF